MRGRGRGNGRVAITARSLEVGVLDASFKKAQMTAFELLESPLLDPSRPLLDQVELRNMIRIATVTIANITRITEIDGGSVQASDGKKE
jgi:hypothetical protein